MCIRDSRNGDSLTLRPEGTAGCARACLEHGLLHIDVRRPEPSRVVKRIPIRTGG